MWQVNMSIGVWFYENSILRSVSEWVLFSHTESVLLSALVKIRWMRGGGKVCGRADFRKDTTARLLQLFFRVDDLQIKRSDWLTGLFHTHRENVLLFSNGWTLVAKERWHRTCWMPSKRATKKPSPRWSGVNASALGQGRTRRCALGRRETHG